MRENIRSIFVITISAVLAGCSLLKDDGSLKRAADQLPHTITGAQQTVEHTIQWGRYGMKAVQDAAKEANDTFQTAQQKAQLIKEGAGKIAEGVEKVKAAVR